MASDLLNRRKGDFQAAAEPLQNITDPIKLKGAFRMLDYFISHCQLVYRDTVALGDETNPTPHNTDLYFVGADYLDLPFWFEDPTIRQGRDDEFAVLESRCHLNLSGHLFAIESRGATYFVVAAYLKVIENDLPALESVIIREFEVT